MAAAFEGILDHYAVLGLDRRCTCAEIRKAFRATALKYHPDKAGSSPEARRCFQAAADAYEVLGNEQSRQAYDAQLAAMRPDASCRQAESQGYPFPQPSGSQRPSQRHGQGRPPDRPDTWDRSARPRSSRPDRPRPDRPDRFDRPDRPGPDRYTQDRPGERDRAAQNFCAQPDTRPTAAELHHGFSQPFRATVSDLQTLATFSHDGAVWLPKVKDVKWCRPNGDAGKVQLTYTADYSSSRSRGRVPLLQLLQTSSCDALQTSFQEHLDRVAGCCAYRHFRMQLLEFPGHDLQFRVKLWLEGGLVLNSMFLLG